MPAHPASTITQAATNPVLCIELFIAISYWYGFDPQTLCLQRQREQLFQDQDSVDSCGWWPYRTRHFQIRYVISGFRVLLKLRSHAAKFRAGRFPE
jgi:hypothetical protein